ncbi:MAG: translation initiation factor IF-2 N-terminal domain-containing protein, partial [bacterium]|nr:translation initiation factor IF-2 N-terminal domain-containing protein [bacterium]
ERQAAQVRAEAAARAPAAAPAPAPVAAPAAPAAATPAPVAPVAAAPAQTAAPAPTAPAPAPASVEAAAPTPVPAPAPAAVQPNQTRTYEPSRERRDDRSSTTTYRPPNAGPFNQRAPRPDANANFGQRTPRPDADRGSFTPRPPREGDARPPRDGGGGRPGETVRYSALAPRPAPRPGAGPGGPRGPRPGQPAEAPATPEVQRATRQAPRPGGAGAVIDRRPEDDDDRRKGAAPGKAVSRTKGEPKRREGRLTIQVLAGDDEGAAERMRSLASVRRAREREKEKRRGGGAEQARAAREVVIPDIITVQELSNRMAVRGVDIIKFLMRQGVMLKINDVIDNDTAELVATE